MRLAHRISLIICAAALSACAPIVSRAPDSITPAGVMYFLPQRNLLVATFAPSMIALRQHAKRQHESMTTNVSFEEWFSQQVPTSARRQIANLTTLPAPLLIGPLGSAVQSAFTGGG